MKNILIHLFNTVLEFNPKKSILKKRKILLVYIILCSELAK